AVRFADGVDTLTAQGVTRFLEIGPDGTLTALAQNCLPDGSGSLLTPLLRKDTPEHTSALRALALLHVDGAEIDWTVALGGGSARTRQVDLPTYAFQRTRFWPVISAHTVASATGSDARSDASFWSVVERGAPELADTLGVPADALSAVLPALTDMRRAHVERAEVDGWRYRVEWEPVEVPTQRSLNGRWLLLQAPGDALLTGLERFVPGLERVTCDARDRAGLARALESAFAGARPAGVLSCLCLSERDTGEASPASEPHAGVADTMVLVQALGDIGAPVPLWVLTRAGFGPGRAPRDPAQAAVWGFGRVAALEHPERWGGLVDLASQPGGDELASLVAVLAHGDEDQVAVRGAAVHARRLRPAPSATPVPVPSGEDDIRVPRRLLVTGGTGALGARVAEWFTWRGTKEVVLASRGGTDVEGVGGTIALLEAAGAERVEVVACDVADRAQVAALLRAHPVDGIAHMAGVPDVGPVDAMTPVRLEQVMAAKALGTAHLEELTREADLSVFVVFSSIAAVWGSGGQAAYAAANAWADAVVEARRARGAVGVSVAWGPWSGGGMVSDAGATELERRGLRVMDPVRALMGLESALAGGDASVVVADVAWERFVPAFTSRRAAPLLTGLPQAEGVREESGAVRAGSAGGVPALVEQVAALAPQARAEALLGHVRRIAAKALGHADTSGVGADRAFRDMGFDSLTAVELRNALVKDTGLSLPTTLVFDHPTPAALARHLDAELSGRGGSMAARLADLESSVARIMDAGPDQDVRTLLGARLRALLDEIEAAGGAGVADGSGLAGSDDELSLGDRLEGASDEELFDLISRELGQ
ncbi:SDR family NAD(P)-dependent oxidoreductase, partial [Streptomyces sp. NPDC058735]|uniref:SDR family NAD(P)-dependent oxidoreductase n=1 Tax=unclassified Streptomyces TaxID=2593676 RepID=UPI0036ACA5D8